MRNNTKLLESFRSECTVIDFLKRDEHWVGSEKFAIVTDLSQAELQNKYGSLLGKYTPFVIITTYQADEIKIFDREVHRQEMAFLRHEDGFGYSDEISEYFHAELAVPSAEDIVVARENEETARDQHKADVQRLYQALKMMRPIQRERLIKYVCMGISITDLAEIEGVSYIDVNHTLIYFSHRIEKSIKGNYYTINKPKTVKSERQVPMLDFVKEAFIMEKEYQKLADIKCQSVIDGYTDFIFLNYEGNVQNSQNLNRTIKRVIRDCNDAEFLKDENPKVLLPNFSCHSLRHTFTTRLCEAGVNVKVIQDVLGHTDITTTLNIYAEATKDMKKKAFDGLDKLFSDEDLI